MARVLKLHNRRSAPDRFETLMRPHFDALYASARRFTLNDADAEDLVQEVCMKAFLKIDDLQNMDHQRAWLLKVLYHQFVDRQRVSSRAPSELASSIDDAGTIALSSFISPYRDDRDEVRELHEAANLKFVEVFVDCSLEVAERRDPKGLYKKARAGEIKNFTGIDDPYEVPVNPEIHLRTDLMTLEDEVDRIINYLIDHNVIKRQYLTRSSDAA